MEKDEVKLDLYIENDITNNIVITITEYNEYESGLVIKNPIKFMLELKQGMTKQSFLKYCYIDDIRSFKLINYDWEDFNDDITIYIHDKNQSILTLTSSPTIFDMMSNTTLTIRKGYECYISPDGDLLDEPTDMDYMVTISDDTTVFFMNTFDNKTDLTEFLFEVEDSSTLLSYNEFDNDQFIGSINHANRIFLERK